LSAKKPIRPTRAGTALLYAIGSLLYRLRFAVSVEPPPEIPEANAPLLFLVKHQSNYDAPLGFVLLRRYFRRNAYCLVKKIFAHPVFLGFFRNIGGIPVDRSRPEASKRDLLYARSVLYAGNALVIFPEQTRVPGKMGEGKAAGFRFITGKPEKPLSVISAGIRYEPGFPRRKVFIRFSPIRNYSRQDDPALFMHERMKEIAELSGMEYPFPEPAGRARRG